MIVLQLDCVEGFECNGIMKQAGHVLVTLEHGQNVVSLESGKFRENVLMVAIALAAGSSSPELVPSRQTLFISIIIIVIIAFTSFNRIGGIDMVAADRVTSQGYGESDATWPKAI